VKHNLWCLLILGFVLAGCKEIDNVRSSSGHCTAEYKEAYNRLGDEFEKLESLSMEKKQEQFDLLKVKCAEFFGTYSDQVECQAERANREVTVKGTDYEKICTRPEAPEVKDRIPAEVK
jgi:hypothetical protein